MNISFTALALVSSIFFENQDMGISYFSFIPEGLIGAMLIHKEFVR